MGSATYTSAGSISWTAPAGVTAITVAAIGGGGGGVSTGPTLGGGGGAYSAGTLAVTPGITYTGGVGAGGIAGVNGASSGFTGDAGSITAGGGTSGDAGGAGGTASGGSTNTSGNAGFTTHGGNAAGSGGAGTGGAGGTTGHDGTAPGGGGAAAHAGADGALWLSWTDPPTPTQTVSPSGIASAQAVGTAWITTGAVTISPGGIPSSQAIGNATLTNSGNQAVLPVGIPSAQAFGTATISRGAVTISPGGIPSARAFGTPSLSPFAQTVRPTGIPSAQAFGTATISRVAFNPDTATDLRLSLSGDDLLASWTSLAPANTTFQIYLNGALAWWGEDLSARLPWPVGDVWVVVGSVADGDGPNDYSDMLPPSPANRALLTWQGGTFLGASAFAIYAGTVAGGAVSYTTPVATVPAYFGSITDGWDFGDYDDGGWGEAETDYAWTSEPLAAGTWNFAVVSQDVAGNASTAVTTSVTIAGPPNPPAANATGIRLSYTFNAGTRVATLHWLVSPS